MTEVEKATAVIAALDDRRRAHIQKQVELDEERKQIAFAAHSGNDGKARKRLDAINLEAASFASEMSSLEAALEEANSRLSAARRDEALQQNRAQAKELRTTLDRFHELGLIMDDCFTDLTSAALEMKIVLDKMHQLGASRPTSEQVRVLGALAVRTALLATPWSKEFDPIAPNQRRSFKSLVDGWRGQIDQNIAARLGEPSKTEAA
jgi:chromosome segregation ATPase